MDWYVVHTLSGHENKVKQYIEAQTVHSDMKDMIGRIVVPLLRLLAKFYL